MLSLVASLTMVLISRPATGSRLVLLSGQINSLIFDFGRVFRIRISRPGNERVMSSPNLSHGTGAYVMDLSDGSVSILIERSRSGAIIH